MRIQRHAGGAQGGQQETEADAGQTDCGRPGCSTHEARASRFRLGSSAAQRSNGATPSPLLRLPTVWRRTLPGLLAHGPRAWLNVSRYDPSASQTFMMLSIPAETTVHGRQGCQSHVSTSLRWPSSPPKTRARTPVRMFQQRTDSSWLALRTIDCKPRHGRRGDSASEERRDPGTPAEVRW